MRRLRARVGGVLVLFGATFDLAQKLADGGIGVDSECIRQRPAHAAATFDRVDDRHVVRIGSALESLDAPDDDVARFELGAAVQADESISTYGEMLGETFVNERVDDVRQTAFVGGRGIDQDDQAFTALAS